MYRLHITITIYIVTNPLSHSHNIITRTLSLHDYCILNMQPLTFFISLLNLFIIKFEILYDIKLAQ